MLKGGGRLATYISYLRVARDSNGTREHLASKDFRLPFDAPLKYFRSLIFSKRARTDDISDKAKKKILMGNGSCK